MQFSLVTVLALIPALALANPAPKHSEDFTPSMGHHEPTKTHTAMMGTGTGVSMSTGTGRPGMPEAEKKAIDDLLKALHKKPSDGPFTIEITVDRHGHESVHILHPRPMPSGSGGFPWGPIGTGLPHMHIGIPIEKEEPRD